MSRSPTILPIRIPFQIPIAPGKSVPRQVYAFAILGRRITLVDTGVAGAESLIYSAIRSVGRRPEDIGRIVLTHAHPDHIGGARTIQEAAGCRVMAHELERVWIEEPDRQNRERPVPGFAALVGGPVHIDEVVGDGQVMDADGVAICVIHTPGHSAGSISLWLAEGGALVSGDAIPRAGGMPIYDDVEATLQSLERIGALAGLGGVYWAWEAPVEGQGVAAALADSATYVRRVHEQVLAARAEMPAATPLELCRRVMPRLGLGDEAINPLTARTVAAHLAAINI